MIMNLGSLIGLSMLALLLGAGMGYVVRNQGWALAALKGLMASFIGGLLFMHLLPEAYEMTGPMSLLFVVLGFLAMILPERLLERSGHRRGGGRFFTAEMLWIGLVLHQATDGIGLAMASSDWLRNPAMAMAVIAHRIPVAAVVFWLFYKQGKVSQAWLRIGAMGLATVLGAAFSQSLEPILSSNAVNYFYAFISGSFLHLMFHDFLDHHAHLERDRRAEFLAFVLGIGLLLLVQGLSGDSIGHASGHDHVHRELQAIFASNFVDLVRETAPYLLLGLIVSGLLHAYMPMSPIQWLGKGGSLKQSVKGMVFGLPLPICSCGVLPMFLSLSRKGVPPACVVAFLIATPELGVDSFLLSVKLLGVQFSVVRLMVAMVLPIVIAMVAVRFLPDRPLDPEPVKSCCGGHKEPTEKPLIPAWINFAFVKLVDDIFPFVFFGLFVAALAQTLWPESNFGELVGAWDVILLALLGIPFYVCASASVPFALVLLQHGFSVGAVVVFLFAGPATNLATVLTVDKAFGKGMGLKLAATAFGFAVITGFLINAVYSPDVLDVLELHQHGWEMLDYVWVGLITLLCFMSLYRGGPLHWFSNVLGMVPGLIHHPPAAEGKEHSHAH